MAWLYKEDAEFCLPVGKRDKYNYSFWCYIDGKVTSTLGSPNMLKV